MGRRLSLTITSSAVRRADSETAEPNEHALSRSRTGSPPDKQMTLPLCPPAVKRKEPYFHSATVYSGLQLYEEIIFGFPLPLRERDRVRGKGAATSLLIQTKNALKRGSHGNTHSCPPCNPQRFRRRPHHHRCGGGRTADHLTCCRVPEDRGPGALRQLRSFASALLRRDAPAYRPLVRREHSLRTAQAA